MLAGLCSTHRLGGVENVTEWHWMVDGTQEAALERCKMMDLKGTKGKVFKTLLIARIKGIAAKLRQTESV